jgi:glycosyltransferase involved in cell wall biosynthesis
MKRTAIVFVTPRFSVAQNGPETYAAYLWEAFSGRCDYDFHIVTSETRVRDPRIHCTPRGMNSWQLFRNLSRRAIEVAGTNGNARTIIHANTSHLDPLLLGGSCPVYGQINDYENAEFTIRWKEIFMQQGIRRGFALLARRAREREFVRRQAITICNSQYTRTAIINAYRPVDESRLVTLYKAVDIGSFVRPPHLERDQVSRRKAPRLVFVGSDFRRKGLDLLVAALPLTKTRTHLTIIGSGIEEFTRAFPELQTIARSDSVFFAGQLDTSRLRAVLWRSDVLVLPSRAEALGIAILEGAAAGLVVVASSVGGIPEIAKHVKLFVRIERLEPLAIAHAIDLSAIKIAQTPFEPAALAEFDTQRMIDRLHELYSYE